MCIWRFFLSRPNLRWVITKIDVTAVSINSNKLKLFLISGQASKIPHNSIVSFNSIEVE